MTSLMDQCSFREKYRSFISKLLIKAYTKNRISSLVSVSKKNLIESLY